MKAALHRGAAGGPAPCNPTERRRGSGMTSIGSDIEQALVLEREHWEDGPPHELFARMRAECPVHWTSHVTEYPHERGFWSVTTATTSTRSAATGARTRPSAPASRRCRSSSPSS